MVEKVHKLSRFYHLNNKGGREGDGAGICGRFWNLHLYVRAADNNILPKTVNFMFSAVICIVIKQKKNNGAKLSNSQIYGNKKSVGYGGFRR